MNPLEQLTAADPVRDDVPTAAAAERMDAELHRQLAAAAAQEAPRRPVPAAGRARVGRRRSARRWALAPVAAGALYAGFALAGPGDGPRRLAPAPASAASVLTDLSRKVAAAPAAEGRYAYEKRLSYVSHMRPKPGGRGTFVVVLPHEDEQWVADDGTAVVRSVIHVDRPTFPTPEDEADYQAADRPPPMDFRPYEVEDVTVAGLPAAEVRALPTDPARLRALIEDGEVTLTAMAGQLLGSALTPPEVKVALFAVLKTLPGATLIPEAKDPRGRTGVGVEFDTPAWKTLFLFDARTGALLGTRSTGRREIPGRTIDDWSLVIASGRRADAPTPATDRAMTPKVA